MESTFSAVLLPQSSCDHDCIKRLLLYSLQTDPSSPLLCSGLVWILGVGTVLCAVPSHWSSREQCLALLRVRVRVPFRTLWCITRAILIPILMIILLLLLIEQQCGTCGQRVQRLHGMAWHGTGWLRLLIDLHLTEVYDSIICPLSNTKGNGIVEEKERGQHSSPLRHGTWCQTSHFIWHGEWWYNQSRGIMTHQCFSTSTHQRAPSSSVWSASLRSAVMYNDQYTAMHCTELH